VSNVLPDASTPFGQQVATRLREDLIGWLTTIGADGAPQPNPVWFFWDGEHILVYNQPNARRLVNIQRNPRVSFHLNSTDKGENIIVISGEAEQISSAPPASEVPGYVEKYRQLAIEDDFGYLENMAKQYSVELRIRPLKVRGF
jgi:PPOX class probable F420-dependent enzyme